ncbi:MAG TPA: hypothetical protein VD930_05165 [Gemmatimonadales bacterium]|nr:hypothetical protein [Gemmatimonadales bacterium]
MSPNAPSARIFSVEMRHFDPFEAALSNRYVLERELGAVGLLHGKRFLLTKLRAKRPDPKLTVVLNYFYELQSRMGEKR